LGLELLNPQATSESPGYGTPLSGNVGDAMNKNSSWFASVFNRNQQTRSIVNAERRESGGNTFNYAAAVANPQSWLDASSRFWFQLGNNNTLTASHVFRRRIDV
jgi:hypothetical protein